MIGGPGFLFAGAAVIAIAAGAGGWKLGSSHWHQKYDAEISAQWQQKAKGEEAVRKVLERDLQAAVDTAKHNGEVIDALHQQNQAMAADRSKLRDQLRGLRHTAGPATAHHPVPEAAGQPGAPGSSGTELNDPFPQLAGNAIEECTRNANRFDALISEVEPQLETP